MKLREGTEKLFESIEIDGIQFNVYGTLIMSLATEWAERMEKCIEEGQTVAECALQIMETEEDIGALKFWHSGAVVFLSAVWVYGDELVDWHNAQYCATECPLKKENEEKV